jgi:tetratricopeptide (TPR) repeat protein
MQMNRRLLFLSCLLAVLMQGRGQTAISDSLARLSVEKTDTGKAKLLFMLSYYYQVYKPDSALLLARSCYDISSRVHFKKGMRNALGQMAGAYNRLGNYTKALETYLQQLKIIETDTDAYNTGSAYLSIAMVFSSKKDFQKALYYALKADSLAIKPYLSDLRLYAKLNIGNMYTEKNQLDSALQYTTLAYQLSLKDTNDLITGTALNNMGNIFFKSGEYDAAIGSYNSSIRYITGQQDYNTLSECYLGLAKAYDKKKQRDSAIFYANKSYRLAADNQFLQRALNASEYLTSFYKDAGNIDSAFAYQQTFVALKDSFDNGEKLKSLQSMAINEEIRQDDLAKERTALAHERKTKLQFLFVGMLIPLFFFISAYISRKRVHKRLIELSGIFSLIFLFEYITLLIHPVVAARSGHSPLIEIGIFVVIAAFLSPTHHKVENWLISKLTKRHHHAMNAPKASGGEDPKEKVRAEA